MILRFHYLQPCEHPKDDVQMIMENRLQQFICTCVWGEKQHRKEHILPLMDIQYISKYITSVSVTVMFDFVNYIKKDFYFFFVSVLYISGHQPS